MKKFAVKPRRHWTILTAVALMVAFTAVIGWLATGELRAQDNADNDAEVLSAALWVSTHASSLFAEHSVETQFSFTPTPDAQAKAKAASRKAELDQHLAALRGKGYDDRVGRIEQLANRLKTNTDQIIAGRPGLQGVLLQTAQLRQDVVNQGYGLIQAGNISTDRNFYDLMGDVIRWTFRDDARRQVHMDLAAESGQTAGILVSLSTTLDDPRLIGIMEDTYITASDRLRHSAQFLEQDPGPHLDPRVVPLANGLLATGDGAFSSTLKERLRLITTERELIADNQQTLELLLAEIQALAAVVRGETPQPVPTLEELHSTPGITDSEVWFGQSAVQTGPAAQLGIGMTLGINAAFEEANRNGGVHGRQLKLTTRDDGYESQYAFGHTAALVDSGQVFGMIGAVGTPTSMAASPVASADGVPFIGPFTGANFLRAEDLGNVVNYRASYYQETERMARSLTQAGVKRVAVLYQDDSYGLDGLKGARQALKRRGLEPVASGYYTRNTSAVKRAAFQIVEAKPEAVIIIGAYEPTAAAIQLLRERLEPDPVFMAVSFVGSEALAKQLQADSDSLENIYVTQVTPLPDDLTSQAVVNYRAALSAHDPDATPGFVSLEGYLVGRMAIAGLQACGPDLSRKCFLDALRSAQAIGIDDISLQFGPKDNQGSDAVRLTVLGSDGNYRQVDKLTRR